MDKMNGFFTWIYTYTEYGHVLTTGTLILSYRLSSKVHVCTKLLDRFIQIALESNKSFGTDGMDALDR